MYRFVKFISVSVSSPFWRSFWGSSLGCRTPPFPSSSPLAISYRTETDPGIHSIHPDMCVCVYVSRSGWLFCCYFIMLVFHGFVLPHIFGRSMEEGLKIHFISVFTIPPTRPPFSAQTLPRGDRFFFLFFATWPVWSCYCVNRAPKLKLL